MARTALVYPKRDGDGATVLAKANQGSAADDEYPAGARPVKPARRMVGYGTFCGGRVPIWQQVRPRELCAISLSRGRARRIAAVSRPDAQPLAGGAPWPPPVHAFLFVENSAQKRPSYRFLMMVCERHGRSSQCPQQFYSALSRCPPPLCGQLGRSSSLLARGAVRAARVQKMFCFLVRNLSATHGLPSPRGIQRDGLRVFAVTWRTRSVLEAR